MDDRERMEAEARRLTDETRAAQRRADEARDRQDDHIGAMLADGWSAYRIAKVTGLSQVTVGQIRRRTHPYYTAKSRHALAKMGAADDADPQPLARWAVRHRKGDVALVAADGRILGEAQWKGDEPKALYVTACDAEPGLIGYEASFADRIGGVRVVRIPWDTVARGQAPAREEG